MKEKNQEKSPSEKPTKEQLKKVKKSPTKEKKPLYPYPIEKVITGSKDTPGEEEEEPREIFDEDLAPEEIEEFSGDFVGMFFEIWNVAEPQIPPLDSRAKHRLGKPLSRILVKYKLAKYAKDEIVFCVFLGMEILPRLKISAKLKLQKKGKKKDDKDDHREKGKGKDNLDAQPDSH